MDGEQETNATPTSFFRGLSDKLDSQQRQLSGKMAANNIASHAAMGPSNVQYRGGNTGNSQPPTLQAVSTAKTPSPSPSPSSNAAAPTVPASLITQVSQHQPPPPPHTRNGHRGASYGDSSADGNGNRSTASTTGNTGSLAVARTNTAQNSGVATRTRQRVHATELVERARYIRNQPKNTSPIDASAHPSLLPPPLPTFRHKKCLILDVDETLVHSSYQSNGRYDVHLPITLDRDTLVNVYVAFRPHLHHFLEVVAPLFEVVIFTASLSTYCDPLMNSIDSNQILGELRLFREHCSVVGTTYVKDLSLLGRNLDQVAIIDNSPIAYLFQQRNAIPIMSWFDDPNDEELLRLVPVLEALAEADTVYDVLDNYNALLQLQQLQDGNGSA